jgi:hypothetical protein
MRYRRDVSRAGDVAAVIAHVRAHLTSVVRADDDPDGAAAVAVDVFDHPDDASMLSVIGEVDAEPDAPYLRVDYVPDETGADLPLALNRAPTDLRPAEYAAHILAKERRR